MQEEMETDTPAHEAAEASRESSKSGVRRGVPEVDPARAALVKEWSDKIAAGKLRWEDDFKQMRENAKFARGKQWAKQTKNDDRYIANITHSYVRSRVATLYAKNPRLQAVRRPKLYFAVWDGTPEMLQQAQLSMAAAQNPAGAQAAVAAGMAQKPTMDPGVAALVLKDHEDGKAKKALYDRMGRSLEIVAQYSLEEPIPKFKTRAKQLVRRTVITGVGYAKLGYQRVMNRSPDVMGKIQDATDRLEHLKRIQDDLTDDQIDIQGAEVAELEANLEALRKQAEVILREGLVIDFPKSWSIIPDPDTVEWKGFLGAGWVAQEYLFTPKKGQELWGVDVSNAYSPHTEDGTAHKGRSKSQKLAAFYEIYDLAGQVTFTICTGYPDFIVEPKEPDVWQEQFHPYYQLSFNDTEDDECIFPPADVEFIIPMAKEYNRAREGLRQHRIANRPAWMAAKGLFGKDTKDALSSHSDHDVIEHELGRDVDVAKLLQAKPRIAIDPALYETEHLYADIQRVGGRQASNLGGTSGATATEVTVAEQSRSDGDTANVDDLDEFLTDLMRGAGQVLLTQMHEQTVKEIAGEGAIWPSQSRKEVARELCLQIRAGSSGRPNRQARLLAIEKTAPFLLQTPGFKPKKMGEMILQEVDETLDIEDFYEEGRPSIVALNSAKKGLESASTEPLMQGPMGGMNAPGATESGAKTQNLGGQEPSAALTAG